MGVINSACQIMMIVVTLLRGVGVACEYAMMYTMVADVGEYGHWKTGMRTPSAIQSAVTSGQKFGQGICSAAIGAIMSWAGYNGVASAAEQTPQALETVYNLFVYGMVATALFMIVILLFYHLDKEYPHIMQELLQREKRASVGESA